MPSRSLQKWRTSGLKALDEIESAHRFIGGGRLGQVAAQQITQAYVVLLSSHFQRFCRDLHSESADHLVDATTASHVAAVFRARFAEGRKLNFGNPNPGNIGADLAHLGIDVWPELHARSRHNSPRQKKLQTLCEWRNAVAHHDFRKPALQGRSDLNRTEVRTWRAACNGLAVDLDRTMAA